MMRGKMFLLWGIVMVMVLFLSLAFSYENEVRSAAGTLAQFVRESGKKTVAVVDFTDLQGNVMELGRFLAEELSIALSSLAQKDFRVMDRTHLRALLKEHQLSLSGLIDPSTARKVGELSGVDALVTGTLTPFGDNVRLALKVIELSTAEILGSASVNIGRTQAINELLSREVAQEAPALVVQETTVAAVTPTPTPKPTPSPTPSPEAIVVETEELVFRVIACGFSEGEFWCGLTVTSKKRDRNLWICFHLVQRTQDSGQCFRCRQGASSFCDFKAHYPSYERRGIKNAKDETGARFRFVFSNGNRCYDLIDRAWRGEVCW